MNQIVIFLSVLVAVSASSVYTPPTRYGAPHHGGGGIVHGGSVGGGFIGGGSFGGLGRGGYGGSGIGTQVIRGPLVYHRLNEYASIDDFPNLGGGFGVGGGIVHGGFSGGFRRGGFGGGFGGGKSAGRIHHGGVSYGRPRVSYH